MRFLKIFALYFQVVFEQRGRSFVWLLITAVVPLTLILFWRGANSLGDWTFQDILSYYLLFIVLSALLMVHLENDVSRKDIQEGELSIYLLKPFSYFWLTFFRQLPYRLFQGIIGILFLCILFFLVPKYLIITSSPLVFLLSVISIVLAYFVSFLLKTIIAIIAFWITETRGLFEATEVTLLIFAGYLMPLIFLPSWLYSLSQYLPFAYMVYFPVVSLQGRLTVAEVYTVLGMQCVWIVILSLVFRYLWKAGVKQYTGVGQ